MKPSGAYTEENRIDIRKVSDFIILINALAIKLGISERIRFSEDTTLSKKMAGCLLEWFSASSGRDTSE
jgi:hypothetical protein